MTDDPNRLIAELADDLSPVRALRRRHGLLLTALALAMTMLAVVAFNGLRPGLAEGRFSVFFLLVNGLLLVLGLASATAVVAMASPRVSARHDGPKWAMATAAVLPLAALVLLAVHYGEWLALLGSEIGLHCFAEGSLASILTAGALLAWLRRGAPVAPARAGLMLGVAAGSLGSFAYGLSCPVDTLYHLAIWHFLPVVLGALLGRAAVPALVRW